MCYVYLLSEMATFYGRMPQICQFNAKKHSYSRDRVKLRGITEPIKYAFASKYHFRRAKLGPTNDFYDLDRRSVPKGPMQGMNKGKRVDKQISRACQLMHKLDLTIGQFLLLPELMKKRQPSDKTEKAATTLSKTLLKNTRAFLLRWHKRGFVMKACQYPVGDCIKRMGTGIDVVLYHPSEKCYLIVNTKVTAHKNYQKYTGRVNNEGVVEPDYLDSPYAELKVDNSQQNQDQLQLLAETILFRKTLPQIKDLKSEINCCDASGVVREYPLQQWAISKQSEFWAKL
jgi:hypothetical protein